MKFLNWKMKIGYSFSLLGKKLILNTMRIVRRLVNYKCLCKKKMLKKLILVLFFLNSFIYLFFIDSFLFQLIYDKPYGKDDTIGCYLDLDSMTIKWSKNGLDLGVAYEIPNKMRNLSYFPSVCMRNAEIKFNFGNTPFSFQPAVSSYY